MRSGDYPAITPAIRRLSITVVTFATVKNCVRTISFKDENVHAMTSINLVDRGDWTSFTYLKANVRKQLLRLSFSETLFTVNALTVCFLDVFNVLSYKPTPRNLFDAYVSTLISSPDGYIPLSYYTHFADPEYSGDPTGMLSNLMLSMNRIIAPLHLVKNGVRHIYLSILYHKTPQIHVYDTCNLFASNKIREEHANGIINGLYTTTGAQPKRYKIIHQKVLSNSTTLRVLSTYCI
ncbi:unnamed protein product [Orchesella dallaii]|uniref:Uncharacterized protein n=1 Tax=Orchesella dallaii TaxID=48710 RepID=A0ABP1R193_9HEXA